MTSFKREINNLATIKALWDNGGGFLRKVRTSYIERGEAILTFRRDQATLYYNGNQLSNLAAPEYMPTINELFLPLLRSHVLGKRSNGNNDAHEYIDETEWKLRSNMETSKIEFSDVLLEICSNISAHKTPESYLVSKLYKYSPLNPGNNSSIVLLDVEAVFAVPGTRKSDRIDLVFYNIDEKQLIFVEAKGLWDGRLFDNEKKKRPAEIIDQMSRYHRILTDPDERSNIKVQYNNVIEYYNYIGDLSLPTIEDKEPLLGLLVFGYDGSIEDTEKLNQVKQILCGAKIKHYCVGDTQNVTKKTLEAIYRRFATK